MSTRHSVRIPAILGTTVLGAALLGLGSCGGGSSAATPFTPPPGGIPYTAGVYQPFSTFAAQCATPRTGTDPASGRAYPDRAGSIIAEKHWLRSWTQDIYLWYRDVPDVNPANAGTVLAYFDQMKTPLTLASGQTKDRFHFTYDTEQFRQLSQGGVVVGYGISWAVIDAAPPRKVLVQFVEPGSVAAAAGIVRGAEVITTDNVDVVNSPTVDVINAALFPDTAATHQLVFKDRITGNVRNASLTAGAVTLHPVPVVTTLSGNLGYILFNDHIEPAEAALVAAINTLKTANVQDLVLDLRYNGGGLLDIASELAFMIAGPTATAGKTFESLQFNDRYPNTDPVTGRSLVPTPFLSTAQGFSVSAGQALPTLNLPRVYVLTSNDTCSASESVINGLRGAGITVYQFGPDTCGKPYGFYPFDNCGTTYFSIQFRGVNQVNFGDYVEGFSVTRTTGDPQANLPGCTATDDLNHDLGDPAEEKLRVARVYRDTATCTGTAPLLKAATRSGVAGEAILQPPDEPWRHNRILR